MGYENRQPPEGINVSDTNPVKEFATLAIGVGALVIATVFVLATVAGWLVSFVPFEYEQRLSQQMLQDILHNTGHERTPATSRTEAYLQELAERLAPAMDLPAEMQLTVHLVEDTNVVNAYATLGGHLVFYRGLLETLPHENALAMVMAHEIAHIKHRDPITAMGRGITVAVTLTALFGLSDNSAVARWVGGIGTVTQLQFSRDQEHAADIAALDALEAYYGHVYGAEVLFEALQASHGPDHIPTMFSSHPITAERIERVLARHGNVMQPTTPLPPQLTETRQ